MNTGLVILAALLCGNEEIVHANKPVATPRPVFQKRVRCCEPYAEHCRACKDCSACKHCSVLGGKCSVCWER